MAWLFSSFVIFLSSQTYPVCPDTWVSPSPTEFSKISDAGFLLLFSVAQSCPTLRDPWLQPAFIPCPSPSPGACSNSRPRWCHPTVSSSNTVHVCMIGNYPMIPGRKCTFFISVVQTKLRRGPHVNPKAWVFEDIVIAWMRIRLTQTLLKKLLLSSPSDSHWSPGALALCPPPVSVWGALALCPPASLCLLTDDAVIG